MYLENPRAVFGVFLDSLYGAEPAWAATTLLTIYGVYCLQDKHLVAALAAATLEQVATREVVVGDIVGLAGVEEAMVTCHPGFVVAVEAAVQRRVGRVVEKLDKSLAELEGTWITRLPEVSRPTPGRPCNQSAQFSIQVKLKTKTNMATFKVTSS